MVSVLMKKSEEFDLEIGERKLRITNPAKLLWPEDAITKLDYIHYLIAVAPVMLPYLHDRLLTTIRYPDGIHGKSFYQKNRPEHAPEWIESCYWRETNYVLANKLETLIWLGNQACLELHVSFNKYQREQFPTELVFDLDPTDVENYELVLEVASKIKEVLDSLGLFSQAKTSGASGLQIYIPIVERYTYDQTRKLNKFIAEYIVGKNPQQVTLERLVKNRGTKLYFDYIQHGEGRTLPAPYSTRARGGGTVSTPVTWEEVQSGFHPTDFTIRNIMERIKSIGDLFASITTEKKEQSLDEILAFLKQKQLD
ncbi:non-homologous end-joining DNA ligase [Ammoniphilus resinae]|uniref:Bifunctional non-homologous end joining protein LigD n=1 Tax=Ammoniphilus resinae TaxID=861532 RepID=A0ABS4GTE7_9BACL|nr:non-homologous end-joining DNA ligase [Ammoniphilus resinae]MBP1933402.1 bifunctional non-homologous end joining protein LigD [Ammoniphilus resinae]